MKGDGQSLLLSPQSFWRLLRAIFVSENKLTADEAASTLFRFFRSKHVLDLKLIFVLVVMIFAVHASYVVYQHLPLHTYLAPAIPIYGGIVAWTYLSAATRLGVVDLFACEIRTTCRVGTAFDIGTLYIEKHKALLDARKPAVTNNNAPPNSPVEVDTKGFDSHEDYFPVFTSNSHDLESLEALVVGNITEFYTYMKVSRDLLRKMTEKQSAQASLLAIENLIYVLFLGYESGRKAIKDLIEFEPTRAENIVVILITELAFYSFLRALFKSRKDVIRLARLDLRAKNYETELPCLFQQINSAHGKNKKDWEPAEQITSALKELYKRAFNEDIETAVERLKARDDERSTRRRGKVRRFLAASQPEF